MSLRRPLLVMLALSCSSGEPARKPLSSALPSGVVARVGEETVEVPTVARIAARRGVSARAAAELALTDAVLAVGARAHLAPGTVRTIERAANARAVLEGLVADVKAQPPPTDRELEDMRRERWVDLDRPDAVRTTHAVVLNDQPARAAEARLVAEKLGAVLSAVTSGEELIRAATAFPGEGFQIRAEALPFVTTDGRVFVRTEAGLAARPGAMDVAFAKAANAVPRVGVLSPIAESSFGYHLIFVEERLPGVSTPREGLASLLGPEVLARRGSKLRKDLVDELRSKSAIRVERAADDLTARAQPAP